MPAPPVLRKAHKFLGAEAACFIQFKDAGLNEFSPGLFKLIAPKNPKRPFCSRQIEVEEDISKIENNVFDVLHGGAKLRIPNKILF